MQGKEPGVLLCSLEDSQLVGPVENNQGLVGGSLPVEDSWGLVGDNQPVVDSQVLAGGSQAVVGDNEPVEDCRGLVEGSKLVEDSQPVEGNQAVVGDSQYVEDSLVGVVVAGGRAALRDTPALGVAEGRLRRREMFVTLHFTQ